MILGYPATLESEPSGELNSWLNWRLNWQCCQNPKHHLQLEMKMFFLEPGNWCTSDQKLRLGSWSNASASFACLMWSCLLLTRRTGYLYLRWQCFSIACNSVLTNCDHPATWGRLPGPLPRIQLPAAALRQSTSWSHTCSSCCWWAVQAGLQQMMSSSNMWFRVTSEW